MVRPGRLTHCSYSSSGWCDCSWGLVSSNPTGRVNTCLGSGATYQHTGAVVVAGPLLVVRCGGIFEPLPGLHKRVERMYVLVGACRLALLARARSVSASANQTLHMRFRVFLRNEEVMKCVSLGRGLDRNPHTPSHVRAYFSAGRVNCF